MGFWEARVRPRMAEDALHAYSEGRQRIDAGNLEEGVALWQQILQSIEPQESLGLASWLHLQTGEAWSRKGRSAEAQAALQAALAQAQDAQTRVVILEALGESQQYASELSRAEASFRSALEVGVSAWGDSLQVAGTTSRLGTILRLQSRTDEAAQLQERALDLRQRQAPDSLEVADSLHQLFLIAYDRRDQAAMSDHNRRAVAIQERYSGDSLAMADILGDRALLELARGRYDEAVEALRRALAIQEQRSPESLAMATNLARLGGMVRQFGDAEASMELLQRALAIREKLAPESLGTAAILGRLADVTQERGDLAAAEELGQRALKIWQKATPEGEGVAFTLHTLGFIAQRRGDLDQAWSLHQRALEIDERLSRHLNVPFGLNALGSVAEERGDLHLALELQQRALAIYDRSGYVGINKALTLQHLGRLSRRLSRPGQAEQFFLQAVSELESRAASLGRSQDLQATFGVRNEEIYQDAIDLELELGRSAEAFHLLEHSRARSFLTLLAQRDLAFSSEAALHQPQPLDLESARKTLDPGTLALAYSVEKDQTALFAVTREGGLRVEILKIGEEPLRQDIKDFLEQIQQQENPSALARSLYRQLIAPVADLVETSDRMLILPDGPLHRLPFGALLRDTKDHDSYLAAWKPLHTALSLTVYSALRTSESTRTAPARPVIAFGDPRYPKDLAASGETRAPVLRGPGPSPFHWEALPYSRREVERIAAVYPETRLYLGDEATEERVKAVARDARVLHFATHGYLDDRVPLDSALVLTLPSAPSPGQDDGLLRVWEIFASVRLDADLVVLSGCETGLGRELGGEGLIGLTRAFQFAGARSVVASLWSVTDQVTAELMARFHRHYAAGLSKDEALREAQIELMRTPVQITTAHGQTIETDASAPFFWAAFQLSGDWR